MRLDALIYRAPGPRGFVLGPLSLEGPDDRPWLILGPAGSGKSTLLRILGGAIRPAGGRILGLVPGKETAYLPQLPERALTGRNLAEDLCGEVRPPAATRVLLRSALGSVGLEGMPLSRKSRRLSTGERRRVSLALLHLSSAPHWAIDEPDAGLDASGRRSLEGWLRSQRARRLWIASHRWTLYAPLAPWSVVLRSGTVLAAGPLAEVTARREVLELLLGPVASSPPSWVLNPSR
jgi:ABC-type multidrug transport system ATPase subunit